jgi:hypothetical protein
MHSNFLEQQVNFTLSIICVGSVALLAIVLMLEASEMENPIATRMATIIQYQEEY